MKLGLIYLLFIILFESPLLLAASSSFDIGCATPTTYQIYDIQSHYFHASETGLTLLNYLTANVHSAAIIARAESDISNETFRNPVRQKYTHTGIVWKDTKTGVWQIKHVLNTCKGRTSVLVSTSLPQFFNDDPYPYYYDFHVSLPSKELQDKIVDILESEVAKNLHNHRYNQIANPFNTSYQNSNTWVLNVIAAAQSGETTIKEVQDYYKNQGKYLPSQTEMNVIKRFQHFFDRNITLEDHPSTEGHNWFNFVSAASLLKYMEQTDKLTVQQEICFYQGCNIPLSIINKTFKL